jgi:hypothetical protein
MPNVKAKATVTKENGKPQYESIADFPFFKLNERTAPQLQGQVGLLSDAQLQSTYEAFSATYKLMLSDPTIAFARMMTVAPLVMAGWSYDELEGAPEGARDFIEEQIEPIRVELVKQIMEGYIDHGWSGHEIVYSPVSEDDTRIGIKKAKPLLQEYTIILVDKINGEWIGFRQPGPYNRYIDLSIYDSLLVSIDARGTNWYGRPLLENARIIYSQWNDVNDAANRYDTKIAGAQWVIHYPLGESPYGTDKVILDNYDIAMKIVAQLQASGKMVVPRILGEVIDELNTQKIEEAWKIELMSDSGSGTSGFVDRMKYLDALKVRAFGFPERAVLEGQFGTKAEAEAHADFAITIHEMRHDILTIPVNKYITNFLLEVNYGYKACKTVCVKPRPMVDEQKAMLKQVYMALIANPNIMEQEVNLIDMQTMRTMLGIPEVAEEEPDQKYNTQQDMSTLNDYFNQISQQTNQTTRQAGVGVNKNGNNSNGSKNNSGKANVA